jgi:hypothetical protein
MESSVVLSLIFNKVHSSPVLDKCNGFELERKYTGYGEKCFPLPSACIQEFSFYWNFVL